MEENVKEESKTTAKSKLSRDVLAAMFMQSLLSNPEMKNLGRMALVEEAFFSADAFILMASE